MGLEDIPGAIVHNGYGFMEIGGITLPTPIEGKIWKWGGSYAVRIPKKVAEHLGFSSGDPVRIILVPNESKDNEEEDEEH